MYQLVHKEWGPGHVEAKAVAQPAPDVVWEPVGDANQLLRAGPRRASGPPGPQRSGGRRRGTNARGPALRERCSSYLALRTKSERPKGNQMTTSTGLAITAYQELAAPHTAVITMGGPGHAGASWPVSGRC